MADVTDRLLPPFVAADMAAFVLCVAGVLYLYVWQRHREPGFPWCAAGTFGLAVWAATDAFSVSAGLFVRATYWHLPLAVGLASMGYGLVRYLAVPPAQRGRALAWTLAPIAGLTAAIVLVNEGGVQVPLRVPQGLLAVYFVALAVLAMQASRREPGCGHGLLAAALLAVPVALLLLALAGLRPDLLRYVGTPPILLLTLTMLAVSLQRRQRLLEQEVRTRARAEAELVGLNATLEQRVAERTDDLQRVILGLESFNRSVSHDLRGPLGGIAQLARMAESSLRQGDHDPALRYLPVIANQAEHSTALLSALLELARVDDAPLQLRPVALQSVALEALRLLQRPSDDRVVELTLQTLPEADVDPVLMNAVFVNLIGNALKFTRAREQPRVSVNGSVDAAALTVHISDNGEGFDPRDAPSLFKPFHRLHGARFGGHGIGLSIVRRVVERHGGRVWADGQPGAGATFSFSIPR